MRGMKGAFPLLDSPLKLVKSVDICYKVYMDYQHERHCVHLVVYHIIWCPKRRRKVLVGPVKERPESIPIIILFFIFQRYFIEGATAAAVKG
jgi:hypothetical protein